MAESQQCFIYNVNIVECQLVSFIEKIVDTVISYGGLEQKVNRRSGPKEERKRKQLIFFLVLPKLAGRVVNFLISKLKTCNFVPFFRRTQIIGIVADLRRDMEVIWTMVSYGIGV